jgi:hypothetical protein
LGKYKISNRGRIKMISGKVTYGANLKNTKYRKVFIKLPQDTKKKQYLIHTLVWTAFNNNIPEGKVIMHNDTYYTLDNEGYERNWLEDLSLGTQQENLQSYHNNRTENKRVKCIDNNIVYTSANEAGRILGINGSSIWSVCNKKWNTAGGLRFEYI